MRFNPLHCGAVVASHGGGARRTNGTLVSIPFIAGQWSLQLDRHGHLDRGCEFQSPSLRGSGRFPALEPERAKRLEKFQSPSLRGSGRFREEKDRARAQERAFQSPSLRGSGRFKYGIHGVHEWIPCFNPLHCGAVVASIETAGNRLVEHLFQSPSLRGSGRFVDASSLNCRNVSFQSPSLRGSGRFRSRGPFPNATLSSFNPLHCGAVVASQARRSASLRACACFNPLHCGAVVASSVRSSTRWAMLSFNPLHCGAVVASLTLQFHAS